MFYDSVPTLSVVDIRDESIEFIFSWHPQSSTTSVLQAMSTDCWGEGGHNIMLLFDLLHACLCGCYVV